MTKEKLLHGTSDTAGPQVVKEGRKMYLKNALLDARGDLMSPAKATRTRQFDNVCFLELPVIIFVMNDTFLKGSVSNIIRRKYLYFC